MVPQSQRAKAAVLRRILPGHTHPRADELLSSWLVRLAAQNGLKLHTFCRQVFGERAVWNRDIDNSAPTAILDMLAERTGQTPDRVGATTLQQYEGVLFERHNPRGNTKWILPLGIYHRTRTRHGLEFCPDCLAERPAYYRTYWRLAFMVACSKHKRALLDRCSCGAPVNFHRGDLGNVAVFQADLRMTTCYNCDQDLRRLTSQHDLAILSAALTTQDQIVSAVRDGFAKIGRGQVVYANLFCDGVRQLLQIASTGRRSRELRNTVSRWRVPAQFEPSFAGQISMIEQLSVSDRLVLMAIVGEWLAVWPDAFIESCRTAQATATDICRNMKYVPYWLAAIAQEHFSFGSYSPALPEISNAIAYVRRSKPSATKADISRILGVTDVFRKRALSSLLVPEPIERGGRNG